MSVRMKKIRAIIHLLVLKNKETKKKGNEKKRVLILFIKTFFKFMGNKKMKKGFSQILVFSQVEDKVKKARKD